VNLALLVFMLIGGSVVQAQDTPAEIVSQRVVRAYDCTFERESNQVRIPLIVFDQEGLPVSLGDFTLALNNIDTGIALPQERTQVAGVPQRPPLQMIIVLDITDTVPIAQLVNAITWQLIPQLELEDQVALITFAESVFPRTRFYSDKNQLINEHLLDLVPIEGDNRLYDALLAAASGFPVGDSGRKVVVLLTDSAVRPEIAQATPAEVIERAQREGVEIFAIGFDSFADRPDVEALRSLTTATGGNTWFYEAGFITRAGIETGVGGFLNDMVRTLSGEIAVTVDLTGQETNSNGLIRFEIVATFSDGTIVADQISCPVDQLEHSISFVNDLDGEVIRGATDVGVSVATDFNRDDTVVRFLRNGEVVQEDVGDTYRLDPAELQPGYYNIGAQLLNRTGDILASTEIAMRLYVQQTLELNVLGGALNELNGQVVVELLTNPLFQLGAANVQVAPLADNSNVQPLWNQAISFDSEGQATVTIPDIQTQLQTTFSGTDGTGRYEVSAAVPGVAPEDPPQAISNPVAIRVVAASEIAPTPQAAPDTPTVIPLPDIGGINFTLILWVTALILFLINVALFRGVKRARIRRIIDNPDDYEMSPQLMTVTVRREGVKQAHTLTKKTTTIGRGSSNDINLGDDPNISRQHGVIMWRKARWYYSNRKRRVMSRVSGKRRSGYCFQELKPIAEIEIGGALLVFHSNAQQDISEFIDTNL
jgi:hypothetical protein